ncbi:MULTISPECIES: SPFH domain-containing protein [unclassified Novosphingobium]|uniref:SPFH domain-containing protein n=1 Tax=Novosphingobium TaxID=165696 RepID=UPI0014450A0C|nr:MULTISPECIES: SPFH domain-containing protein [unclassified Novosphingobium]NKJ42900.1 membrane protease subunit (stomatin/prohibitin family) [Novosphingobium sp. SG720]NMN05463.1 membrane protease subunit (stomatin/prohibitin family) [Novosphingobium sp. SG919]NMN88178.1 membrane protease subunit (stomatin/prohibitin family) [Novosphingobium sp. SG916]
MFDFLKKQFVDIIEWLEEPGQLAWRVPFADQEIQHGAQLTVREGQIAAFVNEGRMADYFGPGLHTLETANLPLLSDLMNWDKGFRSPFKSDVVFLSLKEQQGLKWGTAQPITVRDTEFGALRLRAFGSYSFRLSEAAPFVSRVLGTMSGVTVASLEPQLRAAIQTAIATALGGSGIAFLDLAANQQALSDKIKVEVDKAFAQWGLTCLSFYVESVSLPDEVQAHLDKGSSMRVLGDLAAYTRFQAAEAIEQAAGNDAGMAGIGAGMAAATALGGAMAQGLGATPMGQPAAVTEDPLATIEKLHRLVTIGALSQEEFDAKKAELLSRIR